MKSFKERHSERMEHRPRGVWSYSDRAYEHPEYVIKRNEWLQKHGSDILKEAEEYITVYNKLSFDDRRMLLLTDFTYHLAEQVLCNRSEYETR